MAHHQRFPNRKDEFASDPRITFYEDDQKYILEDTAGSEWEWVDATEKWIPMMNEDDIRAQQQAYAQPGDDEETAQDQFMNKKRKMLDSAKDEPVKKPKQEKKNTAVYVTSLPLDVTEDEIVSTFSKYGLIAEEIESNKKRVKIYTDANGNPKGDALVIYHRPESVQLAIDMLDDSDFRWGEKGPDGKMRVTAADTSFKRFKGDGESGTATPTQKKDNAGPQKNGGNFAKGRKGQAIEKQKVIDKTNKMNQKLADWSDDEQDEVPATTQSNSRWDKFVILKHMFTVEGLKQDMAENPTEKEEFLEDIDDVCGKVGDILGMYLFDLEPEGVVTIRYKEAEQARACVKLMQGRTYGGQRVLASIATGKEKFKKSRGQTDAEDAAEKERLEAFAEFIEQGD